MIPCALPALVPQTFYLEKKKSIVQEAKGEDCARYLSFAPPGQFSIILHTILYLRNMTCMDYINTPLVCSRVWPLERSRKHQREEGK